MKKKTEEEIKKEKKYLKKTIKEYSGYKKIENREQSEKAMRKLIINELKTFSDGLKKVHDKAISNYNVLIWEDIDSLLSDLEIETALKLGINTSPINNKNITIANSLFNNLLDIFFILILIIWIKIWTFPTKY